MKAYLLSAALVAVAAPAAAQSPFDGTFKIDIASAQLPTKPLNRSLKGGVYSCDCDIPLSTPADGQWHKVQGRPLTDEMRVTIIGEEGLRIEGRKAGKPSFTSTDSITGDGTINNWTSTDYSAANGQAVKSAGRDKRVGAVPPKGVHRVNGGWVTVTDGLQVDQAALLVTMKSLPGGLSVTFGTGESYEAKFGGPAVLMRNNPANVSVMLRQISATSFEETQLRDGKPIAINTFVVAPDMSIGVTSVNPIQKTTTKFKLLRR